MFNILINSRTSGKFHRETINGRSHIVTTMMPIRGDTAMNGIHYPDKQVANSFQQLDMLPAPNGHPLVNGVHVPAFHPVANNTHNVGGFIRNPRKKGKRVFTDFLLDETVANQTDEGKEVIKRIENGEKIGVSTGLTINTVTNKKGTDDFGKEFDRVGEGFNFDHVAILLNETAAGEHAGTELVLNENEKDVIVCTLEVNELTSDEIHRGLNDIIRSGQGEHTFTWVQEVLPESKSFIFSVEPNGTERQLFKQSYAIDANDEITLLDDRVEVKRKTEFIPQTTNHQPEGDTMNKELFILAIIANTLNAFTSKDQDKLSAMSESDLVAALSTETTEETARNALSVHGFDFEGYASYEANKEGFDAYQADEKARIDEMVVEIVANTDYTAEMLDGKDEAELLTLNKLIDKKVDRAGPGAPPKTPDSSDVVACNYDL